MEKIGHNERDALKSFVERIENLEGEKRTIAEDIRDVYSEASSTGFDVKIMRKIVAARRKDAKAREEERAILDLYAEALGMGIFA